jgi:hypothetical protein
MRRKNHPRGHDDARGKGPNVGDWPASSSHWATQVTFVLRSDSGAGTNGPGCQIELNVWGSTPNAVWSKKK